MWLLWLCMAALAGHLEDARALMAEGLPETAVVVLDPHLATDPAAALLRFQLAERLGDPEALQAVLSEEVVAHLPWSTRDEAHLLMARRDVATGHIEQARVHLELVFPDADAYGPSRLLVGDLEASEARYLAAVHTWREAVMRGEDVALLRIAEVYERLGRPADAVHYLEMIPAEHPSWWRSRVPLARDLLAIGAEGEAMAVLLDLAKKAVPGDWWVPELQFLRAQAWSQRCVEARAREIRTRAAARLAPVLVLFEAEIQQGYSPEAAWEAHFGHASGGSLPRAWYHTFLGGDDVRPLLARLVRIDDELVRVALTGDDTRVAGLAARRAATVRALGLRLIVAMARERDRIAPWVEGRAEADGLVMVLPEDEQPDRRRRGVSERRSRRWPFGAEDSRQDARAWLGAPAHCPPPSQR